MGLIYLKVQRNWHVCKCIIQQPNLVLNLIINFLMQKILKYSEKLVLEDDTIDN